MSVTSLSGSALGYEMSGPSAGYIAFGFSDDQVMVMWIKLLCEYEQCQIQCQIPKRYTGIYILF